jgi:hypothetical protein
MCSTFILYSETFAKRPFCPISASDSNFNPLEAG